jgi:hypothetical protein
MTCNGEACAAAQLGGHFQNPFQFTDFINNSSNRKVKFSYDAISPGIGSSCQHREKIVNPHSKESEAGLAFCGSAYTATWGSPAPGSAPAPPPPPPPHLNAACLAGDWKEQYDNPFVWHFTVNGDEITIERTDHFVSGTFARTGNTWKGALTWENAQKDVWNNVVLIPKPDCSEIRTNQAWWYHR